jgi:hypothetical protein
VYVALQADPQSMDPGELVTFPVLVMVRVKEAGLVVALALADWADTLSAPSNAATR